jgi:predicted enzyme related to lactoylglutathione lyase
LSTHLTTLCVDANDPLRLARFWAAALGWDIEDETDDEIALLPTDGTPFLILFLPVPEPKVWKNRIHLDLVSESADHRAEMVEQLTSQGARRIDIGQGDVDWTVLADPEGNEFCVVQRGEFLATTGLLGSIVFEPAAYPAVGRFWSEATGWPVVYDEDGDLAIRDPSGRGPFITFGPPVPEPKASKNRLHLDIAPPLDGDQDAEVERLTKLGARPVDIGQGGVSWVVMADPEGNEFCVLTPR